MAEVFDNYNLKPSFTFNIGITGHRELSADQIVNIENSLLEVFSCCKQKVKEIFAVSRSFYSVNPPVLRIISPLAEGSDRMAAVCGLKTGFELQCPLPFSKEEYIKDFTTEESRSEFNYLLSKATSVMEVYSDPDMRSKAYLSCGEIVLEQSDILIAIWNGLDSKRTGGTSDIVFKSRESGIPIIWINSGCGKEIKILNNDIEDLKWQHILGDILHSTLVPDENNSEFLHTMFAEKKNERGLAKLNNSFIKFILSVSKGEKQQDSEKKDNKGKAKVLLDEEFIRFNSKDFSLYYNNINDFAKYYAGQFRAAGLLRQGLPFFACIALSAGFYSDMIDRTKIVSLSGFALQAILLYLIIYLANKTERDKWQQKFMNYRLIVEMLRQMKFLFPLGCILRRVYSPAEDNPSKSKWIDWYFRAIVRKAGLPCLKLDDNKLWAYKDILSSIIDGQLSYHNDTKNKYNVVSKFLEKNGKTFYYIGFGLTILRVAAQGIGVMPQLQMSFQNTPKVFNLLSLVIPAIATALFGIAAQGNYKRLEQRSDTMLYQLSQLKNKLEGMKKLSYNAMRSAAVETANIMLSEVLDWRILIKSKGISKQ